MPSSSNITKKEPDQDQELKEIEEEFDDMYPYTKESSKENLTYFVSAFDELQEQKRKLFGIPEIDNFLSFSDKKNICIINRSRQNNFLYHVISNVCISDHNKKENKKDDGGKTILIDAGNGNNLQFLYLNLVNRSLSLSADNNTMLVNIDNILDNIIVARAFTFYQLANIIIQEIPKIIQKLDNRLQIIVLDLLDTLSLSSSSSSSFSYFHKKNGEEKKSGLIYGNGFQNNQKLLEEMVDKLIRISKRYFVIVSFNDKNKLFDNNNINNVFSKFQNIIEIGTIYDKDIEKIKKYNDMDPVQIKINSKDNNINKIVSIKERSSSSNRTAAATAAKKITEYGK